VEVEEHQDKPNVEEDILKDVKEDVDQKEKDSQNVHVEQEQ